MRHILTIITIQVIVPIMFSQIMIFSIQDKKIEAFPSSFLNQL